MGASLASILLWRGVLKTASGEALSVTMVPSSRADLTLHLWGRSFFSVCREGGL